MALLTTVAQSVASGFSGAERWAYVLAWLVGLMFGMWCRYPRARCLRGELAKLDPAPRLPVFLRFDHRRVVVVGAGPVAASKIPALLDAGADVTVIAPEISPAVARARVHIIRRAFTPGDLDGVWFVTAAATPSVNRAVREAAESRRIFVNAADDPRNATAYLGGSLARGGVTVAISTAGHAPALAGLLREAFDELVPVDIATWFDRARDLSRRQRAAAVPLAERRPQLLEALNRLYGPRDAASAAEVRS